MSLHIAVIFCNLQIDECLFIAHACGFGEGALGCMAVMTAVFDYALEVERTRVVPVWLEFVEQPAVIGGWVLHQFIYYGIEYDGAMYCAIISFGALLYSYPTGKVFDRYRNNEETK